MYDQDNDQDKDGISRDVIRNSENICTLLVARLGVSLLLLLYFPASNSNYI